MIWVSYSLISMAFQDHANENHDYIPEDANIVVRVDGRKLIKSSVSSIILHEDEEIIELFEKAFEDEGDLNYKGIGIELNSDLIFFNHVEGDHNLVGILLNLARPRAFKRNIGQFFGKNHVIAVNGKVGLIYLEAYNPDLKKLSLKTLQRRADKILKQKSKFKFELLDNMKENVFAQSWSKQGLINGANVAHDTKLSFIVTDMEIIIDGEIAYNEEPPKTRITKEVYPDGIHISTDQVTGIIEDSIASLFKNLNLPVAKVTSFSMNYYGLELIVDPKWFPGPKFDALISFEDSYSIETAMDSLCKDEDSEQINNRLISYRGLEVYFQQIDDKTIAVGTSAEPKFTGHDSRMSTWIVGNPSHLTKIDGGGIMRNLLEVIPAFTLSREFLRKMERIGVRISSPKDGYSKVHAVIHFNKGEYALNSVLKMLIQAK